MSVQINGTQGLTFDNGSKLASQLGIFNRVIDGGFIINQRGYVTNTALSSGVYAHDRWKAGSSGCTYTFTQGSAGVNTTITITAGSLQQVIEGSNMPEGGTYTLSWTGTAQARVNGGSYSASPLTTTGLTAGANCTIEFNTGTVGSVQMETGASASSFAFRPYGTELALCQRYFEICNGSGNFKMSGQFYSTTAGRVFFQHYVPMRTAPSLTVSGSTGDAVGFGNTTFTSNNANQILGIDASSWDLTGATVSKTAYQGLVFTGIASLSAEL